MRYYHPARGTELQIDLDHGGLRQFNRRLGVLRGIGQVKIKKVHKVPSKTAGHWHITVVLADNLPVMERILLQCALGSDPVRELLNWARVRAGDRIPVLFIEPDARENDGVSDIRGIFDIEPDEPVESDCLACECELGAGRCRHMEEFQPALQFVRYRRDDAG